MKQSLKCREKGLAVWLPTSLTHSTGTAVLAGMCQPLETPPPHSAHEQWEPVL